MTVDEQIAEFSRERNEALFSLDEVKIRAFYKKWNPELNLSTIPEVFWGSVHKTITGIVALPIEFRRQSKKWLDERGYKSYDDGDL